MTLTLVEQIEEMRIRMHELARREQDVVNALGQALKRADEKLLQAVRNVALEHELRRESILKELHALAARMGALPHRRQLRRWRKPRLTYRITKPACQSAALAAGVKQRPTLAMNYATEVDV